PGPTLANSKNARTLSSRKRGFRSACRRRRRRAKARTSAWSISFVPRTIEAVAHRHRDTPGKSGEETSEPWVPTLRAQKTSIKPFLNKPHVRTVGSGRNGAQTSDEVRDMKPYIPETMKATAIDRYGGPEVLQPHDLPVPRPRSKEVLIRLEAAGIGVWDANVRAGEFELGKSGFPKVLGNDGAGTVMAVGKGVERAKVGDRVYAYAYEGGFYAQYVPVKQDEAGLAPPNGTTEEAGALGADGVTALIGLEDKLRLRKGEQLLVFGASGGIGHLAVQLAKRMGARVLGVASGNDGVELVRKLGA